MFLTVLLFSARHFKCLRSEKWEVAERNIKINPPPPPAGDTTPITRQPLCRFCQNLDPLLGNGHPLTTRPIGTTSPPLPRSFWAANQTTIVAYCTYVLYLTYSTFVPVIKWPRCEKLLKDSNHEMVWEKRFGFSQPRLMSKPMTLFLGTRVSKRNQNLCHILRSAIRDLLLFTFGRHLNRP